jgi:hypothetical protein
MKGFTCIRLFSLLAVSACHQAPQDKPPDPSAQVSAMIDNLYKEVVARHPLGLPDRKVFGPYLSKGLLHGFDLDAACFDRWRRANPDPNLKPAFGTLELGAFSGGVDETSPQAFRIENIETEKDGSSRLRVRLTDTEPTYTLTWSVVAVVIRENGRPVVDDVIYLKQQDRDEERLSEVLAGDCEGR